MRDLTELMQSNVAARERSIAGIQPSPQAIDGAVRRVRRSRAVRHALRTGGAAAVAVVLAGASWYGLRGHETPVPAHTPTQSVTPTAAPTPQPSATVAPVVLDEIPGLPPTQAMPPGLLETTTSGWVLTIYRSAPPPPEPDPLSEEPPPLPAAHSHTVVLVSPAGERYRVVDLPRSMSVRLLRWDAGSTTAVVEVWLDRDDGTEGHAVLDLVSGELTPTPVGLSDFNGGPIYLGLTADGAELWAEGTSTDSYTSDVYRRTDDGTLELVGGMGSWALLDPTGQSLVSDFPDPPSTLVVIDVVHGGRTDFDLVASDQTCNVVSWVTTDALLTVCADMHFGEDDHARPENVTLSRIDLVDGSAHLTELKRFAADEPFPDVWGDGAPLADGRVAFVMRDGGDQTCDVGVSLWDGTAFVPLQTEGVGQDASFTVDAVGDALYVETHPSCHSWVPANLTVHDLTAGTSTMLAPGPAPTGDVPVWGSGLWSWAVAGGPQAVR